MGGRSRPRGRRRTASTSAPRRSGELCLRRRDIDGAVAPHRRSRHRGAFRSLRRRRRRRLPTAPGARPDDRPSHRRRRRIGLHRAGRQPDDAGLRPAIGLGPPRSRRAHRPVRRLADRAGALACRVVRACDLRSHRRARVVPTRQAPHISRQGRRQWTRSPRAGRPAQGLRHRSPHAADRRGPTQASRAAV